MAGGACAFLILLRGRGGEIEAWHRAVAGDCGRTLRRQLWTGGAALPDHVAPPDQAGVIDYRSLMGSRSDWSERTSWRLPPVWSPGRSTLP